MSNLDILEQKIGQAIERLQQVSTENKELKEKLVATELEKQALAERLSGLEGQLKNAQSNGADIEGLRGRVDGILSKFELLDI